jgi:thiol-disulfide isomerase/thioredoxin
MMFFMFAAVKELRSYFHFKTLLVSAVVLVFGFAAVHATHCGTAQAFSCQNQPSLESKTASNPELAPHYYHYSPETLQTALDKGITVLYFWAPWCSTCTSLDLEIQDGKAQIPEHVTVLRVDYDKATELKKKYGVITQHTFVQVDQDGETLSTWVGGEIENFDKYLR